MTKPYRILVTGWRDWPSSHTHVIHQVLDGILWRLADERPAREIIVIQGECPYGGVDLHAKTWAEQWQLQRIAGLTVESHPADRDSAGRILGPARNSRMVAAGADECVAFPGPNSRGTWDCIRKAVDADIPTRVFPWSSVHAADWAEMAQG